MVRLDARHARQRAVDTRACRIGVAMPVRLAPSERRPDALAQFTPRRRLGGPNRRQHPQHVGPADLIHREMPDDRIGILRHRRGPVGRALGAAPCAPVRFQRLGAGLGERQHLGAVLPGQRIASVGDGDRLANARLRALASETTGQPPSPISRRRPAITTRWIQCRESPPGSTTRYGLGTLGVSAGPGRQCYQGNAKR